MKIANIEITCKADLKQVATKDLLDYYNRETGKDTKKFASREKGEIQVYNLIKENMGVPVKTSEKAPVEVTTTVEPVTKKAETKEEGEGRKVTTKAPQKQMKGDRPKETSTDGQVLIALEAAAGEQVEVEKIAKKLGVEVRQVRNSISYLRRRYGYDIQAISSAVVQLG